MVLVYYDSFKSITRLSLPRPTARPISHLGLGRVFPRLMYTSEVGKKRRAGETVNIMRFTFFLLRFSDGGGLGNAPSDSEIFPMAGIRLVVNSL